MNLLLPSLAKPQFKLDLNKYLSHPSTKLEKPPTPVLQPQPSQVPTSVTSSKSAEADELIKNIDTTSHIVTKAESQGSKDIQECFCCFWIFPQSFRGEEKNIHIDRCMEGFGDNDKRLWAKCLGDLKQYRYNFDLRSTDTTSRNKGARGRRLDNESKAKQRTGENGNKKGDLAKREAKKDDIKRHVKENKKSKKVEVKDKSDEAFEEFEPKNVKKQKPNEKTKGDSDKTEKESKPNIGYSKIIAIPLVNYLVFNPSKEFEKFLRRK